MSGANPVNQRPGFAEMLQQLATDSANTIIVESPDRFARDLAVQLAGHDMLKALGISIIPASAPSPELQPIRRWHECKRVHLDGAPTTMPTPLFLRASGKIITLRQKRRTVGGSET